MNSNERFERLDHPPVHLVVSEQVFGESGHHPAGIRTGSVVQYVARDNPLLVVLAARHSRGVSGLVRALQRAVHPVPVYHFKDGALVVINGNACGESHGVQHATDRAAIAASEEVVG